MYLLSEEGTIATAKVSRIIMMEAAPLDMNGLLLHMAGEAKATGMAITRETVVMDMVVEEATETTAVAATVMATVEDTREVTMANTSTYPMIRSSHLMTRMVLTKNSLWTSKRKSINRITFLPRTI